MSTPASKIFDLAAAAHHLRLRPETFSALVRKGFLPPDVGDAYWTAESLDKTVEKLLRDGVPAGQRLPYSHLPKSKIEGGPRRPHEGWRHRRESKLINQPFHSPSYVRQWFELERAYAAAHSDSVEQHENQSQGAALRRPAKRSRRRKTATVLEAGPTCGRPAPPQKPSPPLAPDAGPAGIIPLPGPRIYTFEEVATYFRVSRRTMQEFIRSFPFYRTLGRRKLFTETDIVRLYEALPCPSSSTENAELRTGTSAAPSAASLWTRAAALLTDQSRKRSALSESGTACKPVSSDENLPRPSSKRL